ncbi:glycerol-3-phosphate dehydrogenase subunit GlpB [Halococcus saccharolyticus]|uniref:Anaerobic glycerol-3-phosphate dehydrogenase subunit B n=1 Tax=Halococcus saccharolyticus DSM 5350 TaxID=1227455 RepID=M0ME22_9EURY|nr:glycerol-3-phosphate dehydrogenase subunit GlpB [Halococcus saccharolyticus]EMA43992.1 anaerobic glycerol-3-phosphate dehydrogenase subunit B [Halococcus saccharolyticus DSM 5350]
MAIEDDVLVVGGGLAGMTSALQAAREGARVRLVSHKKSTLRHASGLVDVLGYTPDGELVAEPFDALATLPAGHPYELVGVDSVRDGLALFDEVVGDAYYGDHTDANALVPTHGGTVKPTARYPESTAAGLASDPREALLVGFETLTAFDAPLAADHLDAAGVPAATRGVTVPFPGDFRADSRVTRFARALDRDEAVETATGTAGARRALTAAVEPHLDGTERVGFPAVLGDDESSEVRTTLERHLDVPVFEVPMGPPSLPGIRLERLFAAALDDADVRRTTGNPVVDFEADGERIQAVYVDRNGQRAPFHAEEFILATGGLVGKGIDSDREGVIEPVFDCHVPHPDDRYEWFVDEAFGDHPFARFGVDVDGELRPLDADGGIEYENLRAAGGVLGGADFAAEKSGSGISLATGYAAGRAAGEAV